MSNLDYKATIKPRNKYQRYFHDRPASDWNYTSFERQFTSKHPDKVKKRYKRNLKLIRDYSSDVPDSVSYHIGKLLESIPEDSNPSEPKVTIQHGNYYHFNTIKGDVNISCQKSAGSKKPVSKEDKPQQEKHTKEWSHLLSITETDTGNLYIPDLLNSTEDSDYEFITNLSESNPDEETYELDDLSHGVLESLPQAMEIERDDNASTEQENVFTEALQGTINRELKTEDEAVEAVEAVESLEVIDTSEAFKAIEAIEAIKAIEAVGAAEAIESLGAVGEVGVVEAAKAVEEKRKPGRPRKQTDRPKKQPGRPRKKPVVMTAVQEKRGPGRPRKTETHY